MRELQIRLPPKSPKEMLAEAHARFDQATASLKSMPADTLASLLGRLHAVGEVVAAMEYDRRCSALFRRFGLRTLHDLGKGLGEARPVLLACAALFRSYSVDELAEIAVRARSAEELADLVDLDDPEMAKRLRKRLLSAGCRARRGRPRRGGRGRQGRGR